MKVHTQAIHFSADYKLQEFIEKKLSKLSQLFDRIIEANVILKLENSGQVKDKVAEVKVTLPGGVLFVKETNQSFEASIDSAAASLRRQLIKYKERMRSKAD